MHERRVCWNQKVLGGAILILCLASLWGCIPDTSPPVPPQPNPDPCAGQTGYIQRTYSWWGDYFHQWQLTVEIPRYLYCRAQHANVPRSGDFPWYHNAKLVKWPEDDALIVELAQRLNSPYDDYYRIATNTLHFVQALMPYTLEKGDYAQTPVETLVLQRGDCEDGTILFVALLYALRFPVCFGTYWDPVQQIGHAFGLVQVSREWVEAHSGPFNKCLYTTGWTILMKSDGTLWAMAETTLDPSLGPLDYGGLGCGSIPQAAWDANMVAMFDVETGVNLSAEFRELDFPGGRILHDQYEGRSLD